MGLKGGSHHPGSDRRTLTKGCIRDVGNVVSMGRGRRNALTSGSPPHIVGLDWLPVLHGGRKDPEIHHGKSSHIE